jgi:hypothetical protein
MEDTYLSCQVAELRRGETWVGDGCICLEVHRFMPPEEIHQSSAADECYSRELESRDREGLVHSCTDLKHEPCTLDEDYAFNEVVCVTFYFCRVALLD